MFIIQSSTITMPLKVALLHFVCGQESDNNCKGVHGLCIFHRIQCENIGRESANLNKFLKDVLAAEDDLRWIENIIHKNPPSPSSIKAPSKSRHRQWKAPEENEVPTNSYLHPTWDTGTTDEVIPKWTDSDEIDSLNNYDSPFHYHNLLSSKDGNKRNHERFYSSRPPSRLSQNLRQPFTFPRHHFGRKEQALFRPRSNYFRHAIRNLPIEYGNNYAYRHIRHNNYRKRRTVDDDDNTPEIIDEVKALYDDLSNTWNEPRNSFRNTRRNREPGPAPTKSPNMISDNTLNGIEESKLDLLKLGLPFPKAELFNYMNKHDIDSNFPILSKSSKVGKSNAIVHKARQPSHKMSAPYQGKRGHKGKIRNGVIKKENGALQRNAGDNVEGSKLFEPIKRVEIKHSNRSALKKKAPTKYENNDLDGLSNATAKTTDSSSKLDRHTKSAPKTLSLDTNSKLFVEQLPLTNEERKKNKFLESEIHVPRSLPEAHQANASNSTGNVRPKRGVYEVDSRGMEESYGNDLLQETHQAEDTAHVIRIVKNILRELEERKGERRFSEDGNKASYHKNRRLLSEESKDQSTFSNGKETRDIASTKEAKENGVSFKNNRQDNLSSKPSDKNVRIKNDAMSNADGVLIKEHGAGKSDPRDNKLLGDIHLKADSKRSDHSKALTESDKSIVSPVENKENAIIKVASESIHNMKDRDETVEKKYENNSVESLPRSDDSSVAESANKELEKTDAKVGIKESEQGDTIGINLNSEKLEVKRYTKMEDRYEDSQVNVSQKTSDIRNEPLSNSTDDTLAINLPAGNSEVKFTNDRESLCNSSSDNGFGHSANLQASNDNAEETTFDDSSSVSHRSSLNSRTDQSHQENLQSALKISPNEYRDASQMRSTITGNLASKILHDSLERVNSTTYLKYFLGNALPRYDFDFTFGHGPSEDLYKLEDDNYHQRTEKTLKKVCQMIESLISEEVKKKSCNTLQPDLEDFLLWLLMPDEQLKQESMYTDQDNFLFNQVERDKNKPCQQNSNQNGRSKSSKCSSCKNTHNISSKDIENAIQRLKNLLREYNALTIEEKHKIEKIYQKLKMDLYQLQKLLKNRNHQNASGPDDNYDQYNYMPMPESPTMFDIPSSSNPSGVADYWSVPLPQNHMSVDKDSYHFEPEKESVKNPYYIIPDNDISPDEDSNSKPFEDNYNYIPISTEDKELVPKSPEDNYQFVYIPENGMTSTESSNEDSYKYVVLPEDNNYENLPPENNENNNIFVPMPSSGVFDENAQSSTYFADLITSTESFKDDGMIQEELEKLGLYPNKGPPESDNSINTHNGNNDQIGNLVEDIAQK